MTIFGMTLGAPAAWIIIAGLLVLIEAFTQGLTTIWFAGGAVAASISALLGADLVVQIIVFLVVSIILIAATRPVVKRKLNNRTEKTNIDAVIGQEGIVEEDILPHAAGQVKADGKMWTAVSEGGCEIRKGTIVIVKSVKGVTLTVEKSETGE